VAWPRLVARLLLPCSLTFALACGDDGTDDTAAGTTLVPTSGTSTGSTTTGDESSAEVTGAPAECDAVACSESEVCVVPVCCDGPEPVCFELPASGDCGDATLDRGGSSCCLNDPDPAECMTKDWCIPGPCTPDPPFCVAAEMVVCDFGSGVCTLQDVCSGALVDGALVCEPCDG